MASRPTVSPAKNSLVYFISKAYIDHPVLRGDGQEAKRGEAGRHRITRYGESRGVVLLTCAITALSLIAMWGLIGATASGSAMDVCSDTPAWADGLRARRRAVWWTCRAPALGRHMHREFMRSAVRDVPPLIPTTACHQRNSVARYRRSRSGGDMQACSALAGAAPQQGTCASPARQHLQSHISWLRSASSAWCSHSRTRRRWPLLSRRAKVPGKPEARCASRVHHGSLTCRYVW